MPVNKQKSIVLVQGVVEPRLFDQLQEKKQNRIFVLEGRPRLDSARQLTRELLKRKMSPTLIADNMAGVLFYKNQVKEVWLAYQAIDPEGPICDIGALIMAVLANKHNIPVNVYPRKGKNQLMGMQKDILYFNGVRTAPKGVKGYVPLMELVPGKYITKIYE